MLLASLSSSTTRRLLFGALIVLLIGWSATAQATARIALVIGNGGYQSAPLANPVNDAEAVAAALSDTGFDVDRVIDADRQDMRRAIRNFAERVKTSGRNTAAVFYYAGHGVQAGGRNYLIPIAADLQSAADLEYEAIDAQWALDLLGETRAGVSIVILDACRNNPFRSVARSGTRGLAQMDAPRGSILAYSTAPGAVASDGGGRNSPYSGALAAAMRSPGLSVEEMFKQVRRQVLVETEQRQIPWESSSLVGDFYFGGAPAPGAAPPPVMAGPTPGVAFKDCPECPEMMPLAGGRFPMGAPPGEAKSQDAERPVTEVNVKPFAIGVTEVTRGQFARFVDETGHGPDDGCWHLFVVWVWDGARSWRQPGYPQTDAHPVACISWPVAVAYAEWLSERTGERYRLPSEAEWEFAARGRSGGAPWGGDQTAACAYANVYDKTAVDSFGAWAETLDCRDSAAATAPAKTYQPNDFGLFDQFGNINEWTADCWNGSHLGRSSTGAARLDGDCGSRVWKGGQFASAAPAFRPAARDSGIAIHPNIYGGFRVARDL